VAPNWETLLTTSRTADENSLELEAALNDRSEERQARDARPAWSRTKRRNQLRKIGLISPCGWGNLGDAAIFDAAISNIRKRLPDAEISAFTLNPADTTEKHGIPARTLIGYSLSGYGVREPAPDPPIPAPTPSPATTPKPSLRSRLIGLRRPLTSAPVLRPVLAPLRSLRSAIGFVKPELTHFSRSLRAARNLDLIVVAGGGQLDDQWGGPWGHPYVLCRWALLSRLSGVPFVVLSVGTGAVRSRLGRWFISRSLRWAVYRSYRDQGSKTLVDFAAFTHTDPVVPDLAFSYPVEADPPRLGDSTTRHLVVGVSPMCFADPRSWPDKDAVFYQNYVQKIADFVARLSASDFDVVLFASQHVNDRQTVTDVQNRLCLDGYPNGHTVHEATTAESLMDCLRTMDVVVASRLHGVLLAHLTGRPVLAISHERKVSALMADFENDEFCLDINTFEVSELWDRFHQLVARRHEVVKRNIRRVQEFQEQVQAQFDRILAT
jgi:polysaccharide pyruvyl transferase WcaK-like protein